MKIIRGTRDAKGNVFQKQPEGGTGRTICMKDQGICTTQRLADGTLVHKCNRCGAVYQLRPLDGPKAPRPGVIPRRVPAQSDQRR
jgi:hypothetical protein